MQSIFNGKDFGLWWQCLTHPTIKGVYVSGSTVYTASAGFADGIVDISTDQGANWNSYTLQGSYAVGIYVDDSSIYTATTKGVFISSKQNPSFVNHTAGLASTNVICIFVANSKIYAGTQTGLYNSPLDGSNFTSLSLRGEEQINGVYVSGSNIYAATQQGLYISTNGGVQFNRRTKANSGLADDTVRSVYVHDSIIYAGTLNGLSVSKDGGTSFATTGLSSNVNAIFVK